MAIAAAILAAPAFRRSLVLPVCWRICKIQSGFVREFRGLRFNFRRNLSIRHEGWSAQESPYEILGVERGIDEDGIKTAYRRLAKQYHPDVYNGSQALQDGETVEARFIKIQAAYELLVDYDKRRSYDADHRTNPMTASKAWVEWVMKKKQAFEQRGDLAAAAWAQQQQREMNLKARKLSRDKMNPEEEKRIIAKERLANAANMENTVKRHNLILKKRDLVRKRTEEEAQKKLVQKLLASEGLELDDERFK